MRPYKMRGFWVPSTCNFIALLQSREFIGSRLVGDPQPGVLHFKNHNTGVGLNIINLIALNPHIILT